MKKRNLFICLIFTFLMCFSFNFSTNTKNAFAVSKTNSYTISETNGLFSVIGETTETGGEYVLTSDSDSLETAITLIQDDLTSQSSTTTINFDNITLVQNLNLSFQNLTISGTLNLDEYSLCYTTPVEASVLNLTSLTLNSNSSQDLVQIAGENYSNISISDVVFNSASAQNNYSIKLIKPVHTLYFTNTLSYSTKYLYNYEIGSSNRKALFESNFSLTSPSTINITIPYNADGKSILTTRTGSSSLFSVFPNQSNFTCSVQSNLNGGELSVRTNFNINFDTNGGTGSTTSLSSRFYQTSKLEYPTDDYSKEHFNLNGFLGKLTLDAETISQYSLSSSIWYFDATALQNFINYGSDLAVISNYFYSEISDTELTGFTFYQYDTTSTNLNFLAVKLMLDLNQNPEFVAIWNDTIYTLTFDENGGQSIADTSGIFGSSVTLPTPTKTGFSFVGWFDSLEKANEALTTNVIEMNTMPDTNPTLYAGWLVHSHTLSIYQYNQLEKIEKTIDFGTLLNTIQETDDSLLSKTGYSFAGWYTDSDFSTPLDENATMPDENLSIYAKWNINQYTISLYLNHETDSSLYKTTTRDYNSNISDFFVSKPSFEGFKFNSWCTDKQGRYPYITLPDVMPAEDLTLYASWSQLEYVLTIYYPAKSQSERKYLHFGDELALVSPEYSGLIFEGWFTDSEFTQKLTQTTMPSSNFSVYAKLTEKQTISLDLDSQSYTISENKGFVFSSNLKGFVVEYLVDDKWTTTTPTAKGSYDVRISRAEDSLYKSFVTTIENGFEITSNIVDLGIYYLILYCVAGLELLCAIIILFIRKQRKTYLTYAIALPFGVVSNSQFTNLIISLTLAVFGFVLIVIQIVKLRKINNEIAKISTEQKDYVPPDVSEDDSISRNVEILLQKEGFVDASDKAPKKSDSEQSSNEDLDEDDEYLSFGSKKNKNK